jgi:membrane protein DedA with SNARE-associated domain
MPGTVSGLVASYGYVVVFLLVGLESLGIPLPGETALVTAAAYAALGHLSIYAVVMIAVAAAIIGDNAGYWIGRKGGIALVRRYGRLIHLNESHLERARIFFERHGSKTVFIGRFIALLRTWAAVLAGAARMPYGTFMFYNALGGVCWAVIFGTLGYVFGRNLPHLEHYVGQASLAGVLLVALFVGLVLGWRWFETNRARLVERTQLVWQRVLTTPGLQQFKVRYPRA